MDTKALPATVVPQDPIGLARRLRERTAALHTRAEGAGVIREILRGEATRAGYTMYLRNLLVAYQALERGLTRYQAYPGVRLVACAELFRSAAIERDLAGLCGPGWAELVPLLSAGRAYAEAIEAAGGRDGVGLIGHAYTRYLGDLSGAQLLKRSLERSLGLGADCLAFYAFPDIADLGAFRAGYRTAIDAAADEIAGHDEVIAAAEQGFSHTIDIALAIQGASVR